MQSLSLTTTTLPPILSQPNSFSCCNCKCKRYTDILKVTESSKALLKLADPLLPQDLRTAYMESQWGASTEFQSRRLQRRTASLAAIEPVSFHVDNFLDVYYSTAHKSNNSQSQQKLINNNSISPDSLLLTTAGGICDCVCHSSCSTIILVIESVLHDGYSSSVTACRVVLGGNGSCYANYKKISRSSPALSVADSTGNSIAKLRSCSEIVIKLVRKPMCSAEELQRCLNEVRYLKLLLRSSASSNNHLIQLLASFESTNEIWMIFERADFTDLYITLQERCLSPPNHEAIRILIKQLLQALKIIHDRGIVHCDIKPRNIFLYKDSTVHYEDIKADRIFRDDWSTVHLKLGDFGLARMLPSNSSKAKLKFDGVRGSSGYFAPEVLLHQDYDSKVDMWALGVITFSLLAGYEPFYPPSKCISERVQFKPEYWNSVPIEARDFCSHLLQFDPDDRFSSTEALQHPWMMV